MKRNCFIHAFIFALSAIPLVAYSSIPISYFSEEQVTDQQLKDLAVEKLFVPYNSDRAYFENELKQKHTITIWIISQRNQKIELIDALRKIFLEKEDAIIRQPSSYYVDGLNRVIYNTLSGENGFGDLNKGLGAMFKSIALMDGDFDNGKSTAETLKSYSGEELFEYFKENYPDKYENLIRIDKERGRIQQHTANSGGASLNSRDK